MTWGLNRSELVRRFPTFPPLAKIALWLGAALLIRWGVLWAIEDEYRSRVPSLMIGSVLVIVAVQIWVVAFLADLQAAARRLLSEARARDRDALYQRSG